MNCSSYFIMCTRFSESHVQFKTVSLQLDIKICSHNRIFYFPHRQLQNISLSVCLLWWTTNSPSCCLFFFIFGWTFSSRNLNINYLEWSRVKLSLVFKKKKLPCKLFPGLTTKNTYFIMSRLDVNYITEPNI